MVSPIYDFLSTLSTSQCWPTSSRHCVDIILAFAAYPYVLFTSSILFTSQYWPTSTRHYVYIVRLLVLDIAIYWQWQQCKIDSESILCCYVSILYTWRWRQHWKRYIYIYWTWIKSYFKFLKTYEWIIKIET